MDYSKVFFVVLAKLNIILAFSKNKLLLQENVINSNVFPLNKYKVKTLKTSTTTKNLITHQTITLIERCHRESNHVLKYLKT